eukprot:GHVU01177579.1.p1 GENE.GHVU01177579.1~~GHVU01177579.1.p1  ORF type:complete len:666 (+),score=122.77 GHVU01177579.1:280-2277(+)
MEPPFEDMEFDDDDGLFEEFMEEAEAEMGPVGDGEGEEMVLGYEDADGDEVDREGGGDRTGGLDSSQRSSNDGGGRTDDATAAVDRLRGARSIAALNKLLFGSDWEAELYGLSEREGPSGACGRVLGSGEFVFRCTDCQIDTTCIICPECFFGGNHEGHDTRWQGSTPRGCCDCGDAASWKPEGNCSRHVGVTAAMDGPDALEEPSYTPALRSKLYDLVFAAAEIIHRYCSCPIAATGSASILEDPMTVKLLITWLTELCRKAHGIRYVVSSHVTPEFSSVIFRTFSQLTPEVKKAFLAFILTLFVSPGFKQSFAERLYICPRDEEFNSSNNSLSSSSSRLPDSSSSSSSSHYSRCEEFSAQLDVQLLTVPDIALHLVKRGFLQTIVDYIRRNSAGGEPSNKSAEASTSLCFLLDHESVAAHLLAARDDPGASDCLLKAHFHHHRMNEETRRTETHVEHPNRHYADCYTVEWKLHDATTTLCSYLHGPKNDVVSGVREADHYHFLAKVVASVASLPSTVNDGRKGSFHAPVTRLFSKAVDLPWLCQRAAMEDPNAVHFLRNVSDYVLEKVIRISAGNLMLAAEVARGYWVRNGREMLLHRSQCSQRMLKMDLSAIQLSGVLLYLKRRLHLPADPMMDSMAPTVDPSVALFGLVFPERLPPSSSCR